MPWVCMSDPCITDYGKVTCAECAKPAEPGERYVAAFDASMKALGAQCACGRVAIQYELEA